MNCIERARPATSISATTSACGVSGEIAAQRSSAATLSSMLQQISMLFGVAVAAAVLNLSQIARGGAAL
ncbi:hypothetical protein EN781_33965, partial [Mesorhizobium sp. M4A.F.Ca.ET.090.04.2.1]